MEGPEPGQLNGSLGLAHRHGAAGWCHVLVHLESHASHTGAQLDLREVNGSPRGRRTAARQRADGSLGMRQST